jgi:hypothetical protein
MDFIIYSYLTIFKLNLNSSISRVFSKSNLSNFVIVDRVSDSIYVEKFFIAFSNSSLFDDKSILTLSSTL